MNIFGLLILLLGVVLIIMGIRGTGPSILSALTGGGKISPTKEGPAPPSPNAPQWPGTGIIG